MFSADRSESFELATSLYEKDNYIGSKEACEQLIELHPFYLDAALLLSDSYFMQGKYNESRKSLYELPTQYYEYEEVMNNLAANFLKEGLYQEAIVAYNKAVTKNPYSV